MGYHLHGCCWIRWKKERREAYFPLKEICEVSRRQYSNCTINHIGWLRLCCTILNRVDIIWTILYPFPYHIDVIPSMWRMLRGFPWLHSHNWYSWCQGCDWSTANGDPDRAAYWVEYWESCLEVRTLRDHCVKSCDMSHMLSRHQQGLLTTPASSVPPVSSECAEGYEGDKCEYSYMYKIWMCDWRLYWCQSLQLLWWVGKQWLQHSHQLSVNVHWW